jgi:hypothetical protein
MLVDELRMSIAAKEDTEIIEPADDPLQLHAVDEEDGQRCFVFANIIEKSVLQVLSFFSRHNFCPFFLDVF